MPCSSSPSAAEGQRTERRGAHGDALRVRLEARRHVDNETNAALIAWAAKAFGVPKGAVELLHGAAGRQKVLSVRFDSEEALRAAQAQVQAWMQG